MGHRQLISFEVIVLLIGLASCKTTSPQSGRARLKDSTIEGSSSPLPQQSPDSASSPQLPEGSKPAALTWVVVTPGVSGFSEGEFSWKVELRTAMEVWCETTCSEFRLIETPIAGIRHLTAARKRVTGNTSPGILIFDKDVRGARSDTKKVVINNVGVNGNHVVLEDVITSDRPNFYAVPMRISLAADTPAGSFVGDFGGKRVEIRMDTGAVAPEVVKGGEPVTGFVMGSILKEDPSKPISMPVFMASRIILPWSED